RAGSAVTRDPYFARSLYASRAGPLLVSDAGQEHDSESRDRRLLIKKKSGSPFREKTRLLPHGSDCWRRRGSVGASAHRGLGGILTAWIDRSACRKALGCRDKHRSRRRS